MGDTLGLTDYKIKFQWPLTELELEEIALNLDLDQSDLDDLSSDDDADESLEIASKRSECNQLRRQNSRALGRRDIPEEEKAQMKTEYKNAKKVLQNLIKTYKREHWKTLGKNLEDDVWGNGYKIAMSRLVSPSPVQITDEMAQDIAKKLFPRTVDERPDIPVWVEEEVRLFTEEELHSAAASLKNGKAPRRDGIPSEAINVAVKTAPEWIREVLRAEDSPTKWKLARLVLIP
ncbi:hypothetical protein JTB14_001408 [Gonioctena quinquepunctata]|nr:hypothetical protein JTB14_001408 [Gonioctena quinquepunctata]